MLLNDPLTLLYLITPFGLMTTLVLCLSYVGHGRHSPALHAWIAGDLVLAAYRVVPMLQPGLLPDTLSWLGLFTPGQCFTLNIALLLVAIGAHTLAMHYMGKPSVGNQRLLATVLGPAMAFALGAQALLPSGWVLPWFTGWLALSIAWQLRVTWPLRKRYRGAWGLIAGHVALVLFHAGNTLAMLLEPPPALLLDAPDLPSYTALAMDFMVSFLFTLSFALMLQEQLRHQIHQLSVTDSLTGAFNRRGATALLRQEWAQALMQRYPAAMAMIDLDHFKRINDQHGHATGDAALQVFARTVQALKRQSDVFVRWGGEEFLLVFPHTEAAQAQRFLERLKAALAANQQLPFTLGFSAGLADTRSLGAGDDFESLLAQVDQALYRAKQARGQVEVVA
ncbi:MULTISPECIES: diguanylate cyclase [unclassified Pseudomonas]|uniref:GGDEF domain-containing protein n=1 Tax=unclassified Pseudomonas TaxID=196821 RepID=UPI000BD49A37|nr:MULTISPECIES: GGDEF domain-containing protein [unclassified Pseudomonas]PVZ20777.1 diguanylate cyclase (GGDEF)-like protein [Pseudomonas sp. URIL14HWK12:I12]PVZ27843.1 diguanylate cyclase (GGDEF)-like protein [Pseudomonas sp. URIL14HWK12:I10]PVZ38732.1 diguanylate cyclase (GGDEF)-like protein [Pseudomonas sp. URIL14HWK12:I11]SNZ02227.1 diguanylate cyclase (GGDEF) domain-containing protein [Pseudomonas sp. URIL14HWK12:I9]